MARDTTNQKTANYGGYAHDFGFASFSGTGGTLEVTTNLSEILGYSITAADAMTTGNTVNYFIDETISGGGITVSGGTVTFTRIAEGSGTATSGMTVTYHLIGYE